MAWFAFVMRFSMSLSSVKSNETKEPRYLKWAVKSMKDPLSSSSIPSVIGEFQYIFSLCSAVMVLKVRGRFLALAISFGSVGFVCE